MLAGLFRGAVAELVDEALSSALAASPAGATTGAAGDPGAAGPLRVAVIGDIALGRALAALHKRRPPGTPERPLAIELMIVAEPGARAAKKLEHVLAGTPAQLPVADGELAAVIGVGALAPDNAVALHPWITEWVRAVRDGGAVVLVDRAPRTLATRHALCAGLTEIEQRASGRAVVTSGLTTKQPPTRSRR